MNVSKYQSLFSALHNLGVTCSWIRWSILQNAGYDAELLQQLSFSLIILFDLISKIRLSAMSCSLEMVALFPRGRLREKNADVLSTRENNKASSMNLMKISWSTETTLPTVEAKDEKRGMVTRTRNFQMQADFVMAEHKDNRLNVTELLISVCFDCMLCGSDWTFSKHPSNYEKCSPPKSTHVAQTLSIQPWHPIASGHCSGYV